MRIFKIIPGYKTAYGQTWFLFVCNAKRVLYIKTTTKERKQLESELNAIVYYTLSRREKKLPALLSKTQIKKELKGI